MGRFLREFPSLKGFNLAIDFTQHDNLSFQFTEFPSLKGFNLAIDACLGCMAQCRADEFPSLKGFNLAIDLLAQEVETLLALRFHPSKGSTSL